MSRPKHFEELWEEAEKQSTSSFQSKEEVFFNLSKALIQFQDVESSNDEEFKTHQRKVLMGKIIYYLSFLSNFYNINTFTALENAIEIFKAG